MRVSGGSPFTFGLNVIGLDFICTIYQSLISEDIVWCLWVFVSSSLKWEWKHRFTLLLHWLNELYSKDLNKCALNLIHKLIFSTVSLPRLSKSPAWQECSPFPHISHFCKHTLFIKWLGKKLTFIFNTAEVMIYYYIYCDIFH